MLRSRGQNQQWATSGHIGYTSRLESPQRFKSMDKFTSGPQVGKLTMYTLPSRGSPTLQSGSKISSGPQVGMLAT